MRHVLVSVHDVVGGHFCHLCGCVGREHLRLVNLPVGTFDMVVGAQKGVHALRAVLHVGIGGPGAVVGLVVLAWAGQRGQTYVVYATRRQG